MTFDQKPGGNKRRVQVFLQRDSKFRGHMVGTGLCIQESQCGWVEYSEKIVRAMSQWALVHAGHCGL